MPAGIVLCDLILCYLCKLVYVISGMSATESKTFDMRTGISPLIGSLIRTIRPGLGSQTL